MRTPEVLAAASLPPMRDYQRDMLEAASQHDSIVYLETGMGKTRIALELIASELPSLRRRGQVALFLAPSVPLVRQQAEVLASAPAPAIVIATATAACSSPCPMLPQPDPCGDRSTAGAADGVTAASPQPPLASLEPHSPSPQPPGAPLLMRVECLGGNCAHGSWGPERWAALLRRCDVLVCTPAVLLGALVHALVKVSDIGLVVVDEAHHCHAQHPYAVLMREFIGRAPAGAEQQQEEQQEQEQQKQEQQAAGGSGERTGAATMAAEGAAGGGGGERDCGSQAAAGGPRGAPPRPRVLGLTASPLGPLHLQGTMCGGRLITPLELGEMAARPSRPKATVCWVGPGAQLPPPAVAVATTTTTEQLAAAGPSTALPPQQPQGSGADSQLISALTFCKALLLLAERVVSVRDRLQRLHHLGEISWEELGLPGDEVPAGPAATLLAGQGRDQYDASLRDLRLLKSQVSAVEAALVDLGPWPALALAAADLFSSPSERPPDLEVEELAEEDRNKMLEPTDLGPAPTAAVGRDLMADMVVLQKGLELVGLPSLSGRVAPTLGERVAAVVLALVMEGFLKLLLGQRGDEERAAEIAQGFGRALLARGGARSCGRSLLSPWAQRLLDSASAAELQQQVLGVGLPAGGPLAGPSAATPTCPHAAPRRCCLLPLVSLRVCWLLRQLHTRALVAAAAASGGGQGAGGSAAADAAVPAWSAMVFCERKSTCEALYRLVSELPALQGVLRAGVFMGANGSTATSGSTKRKVSGHKRQEEVRREFSSGRLNLLLSTSVGAEGLDFSHCALVAALDLPKHVTPFVQSGGRARAPGAEHWLLVSSPQEEAAAAKLLQAEEKMLLQAQTLATANYRAIADPSAGSGSGSDAGDDVMGEGGDVAANEEGQEHALEVATTGARLPAVWAVDLLLQLCFQLPGNDGCTVLQPLFRWQEAGPAHARSFSYRVFLPANLAMEAVNGPHCGSKDLAKKLACLEAVRRLWQRGDLDDHLRLRFTRRAATRAAHKAAFGGFQHSIPQVTLTHRLPKRLRPNSAPASGRSDHSASPSDHSSAGRPSTAPYHLYGFLLKPKSAAAGWRGAGGAGSPLSGLIYCSMSQQEDVAGSGGGDGGVAAVHCWGVVLHGLLPPELPPFDLFLPSDGKGEFAVQAQPLYLGPLPVGPSLDSALNAIGVVVMGLATWPCPAAVARAAAAAGQPLASPPVSTAQRDEWERRVGFRRLAAALRGLALQGGSDRSPDQMDWTTCTKCTATDHCGVDGTADEGGAEPRDCDHKPTGGPDTCWWTAVPLRLPYGADGADAQGDAAMDGCGCAAGSSGRSCGSGNSGAGGTAGGVAAAAAPGGDVPVVPEVAELVAAAARDAGGAEAVSYIDWAVVRSLAVAPAPLSQGSCWGGPAAGSPRQPADLPSGPPTPIPSPDSRLAQLVRQHGLLISLTTYRLCAPVVGLMDAAKEGGGGGGGGEEVTLREQSSYGRGWPDWLRSRTEGGKTHGRGRGGRGGGGGGGGHGDSVQGPQGPEGPQEPGAQHPRAAALVSLAAEASAARPAATPVVEAPSDELMPQVAADGGGHPGGDGPPLGDCGGGAAANVCAGVLGTVSGAAGRVKVNRYREAPQLLPELLALFPLDAARWRLLQGLPAIMWRLEGLVAAAELLETTLRPARFAPVWSGAGRGGGRPADAEQQLLLTASALTAPAARDPWFNNDRLEYLGDAVLKLLAHLYVFLKERHVPNSHEGVLSFMRDALVANEVLAAHALGARLDLAAVLRALPFERSRALRQALLAPDEVDDGTPLHHHRPLPAAPAAAAVPVSQPPAPAAAPPTPGAAAGEEAGRAKRTAVAAAEPGAGGAVARSADQLPAASAAMPLEAAGAAGSGAGDLGSGAGAAGSGAKAAGSGAAEVRLGANPPEGAEQQTGAGRRRKPARTPRQQRQGHVLATRVLTGVNGKRMADCLEALIGAHLLPALEATAGAGAGGGADGVGVDQAGARAVGSTPATCSPEVQAAVHAALCFCVGGGVLPEDASDVILQGLEEVAPGGARAGVGAGGTDTAAAVEGGAGGDQAGGATRGSSGSSSGAALPRDQKLGAIMTGSLRRSLAAVEELLGHSFSHPMLCVQALTHVSHPRAASCGGGYQRVEFLGDAVLGLVASLWAYREGGSAEDMTVRRSELVSNGPLAAAAVRSGLHLQLHTGSGSLEEAVARFAASYQAALAGGGSEGAVVVTTAERLAKNVRAARGGQQSRQGQRGEQDKGETSKARGEAGQQTKAGAADALSPVAAAPAPAPAPALRAPKALADVLEALVGAVYLDSGGNLEATERAVARMLLT